MSLENQENSLNSGAESVTDVSSESDPKIINNNFENHIQEIIDINGEILDESKEISVVLTLIFGFIVGYCLIKSFFDGLKV